MKDDYASWGIGQRVCRKDNEQLGTIVSVNGDIKVKWDDGSTSYFKRGKRETCS